MNKDIFIKASQQLLLDKDYIESVYKCYWLYIKTVIEKLPLKEDLSEEEFNKLKTSFNIPSLGKLYCTYDLYKYIKLSYKNKK